MWFKRLILFCLLGLSTVGAEETHYERCGNTPALPEDLKLAEDVAKLEKARKELGLPLHGRSEIPMIEVPTYFHYVNNGKNKEKMRDKIERQGQVLNEAFRVHGISFRIIEISHVQNKDWARGRHPHEMMKSLRKGDYTSLNIFILHRVPYRGRGALGLCTLPKISAAWNNTVRASDGCRVWIDTIPGMARSKGATWTKGFTAVHEVGHWFGLLHPFSGGCDVGDNVIDTEPSAKPIHGCPIGSQSCGHGIYDAIHNFMAYTNDDCKTDFTDGPSDHMHNGWSLRVTANGGGGLKSSQAS